MTEILKSSWDLIAGLAVSLWGIIVLIATWVWDVLYHLHVTSPRLEGLLIGIALAWVLLRRERHPLLRVLSSPLKLILDILDLAWDQIYEVIQDVWGTVSGWVKSCAGWCKAKVVAGTSWVTEGLKKIKEKLSKKEE